ncbi:MAG: hypothetical protein KTR25_11545 [Myxococcales bacterium]|nr:hypothetical protein [Myxococcales bacterium]
MNTVLHTVLRSPLAARDQPTDTHYTVEGLVFWKDDFLDSVRLGLHRRLIIGGLRSAGQNNLVVELAAPLRPYTAVFVRGLEATVVCPMNAEIGMYRADGALEVPLTRRWNRAPFPAVATSLKFYEQIAFRVETLTFLFRFVHRDGKPRHRWDWVPAAVFSGYMG